MSKSPKNKSVNVHTETGRPYHKSVKLLLDASEKQSIFKMIVFFKKETFDPTSGEVISKEWRTTMFSKDFSFERDMFDGSDKIEYWRKRYRADQYNAFSSLNGYKRLNIFINKVAENGELKMAIIYANKILQQTENGFWPMEICRIEPTVEVPESQEK